jgi:hypothetical protein
MVVAQIQTILVVVVQVLVRMDSLQQDPVPRLVQVEMVCQLTLTEPLYGLLVEAADLLTWVQQVLETVAVVAAVV